MKALFILLLLPAILSAQKDYPAMFDAYMKGEVSVNKFNGNLLIAQSDHIIYQKAFGYRNYLTKESLDNNSIFGLASITKEFTAMGILLLKERGKLTLNDSLRKFFPELPYSGITIQHMLTHTSGLPDEEEVMKENWNHKVIASNSDLIKVLANKQFSAHFQPGKKWEYSNTAFELLASIIEKVSGISYKTFIQNYIFDPLKMTSSLVTTNSMQFGKDISNYAYGYIYSDSLKNYILPTVIQELDFVFYLDGLYGAGDISSTTGDLLKWDRAIKNHTLLSERTQNEMLSPQSIQDTVQEMFYGYGEMLGRNEIGNYVRHGGGWPGYHTMNFRYLTSDITIIVLSNNESNSTKLCGPLSYIMTDRPVVIPYIHNAVNIDFALLDNYKGMYSVAYVPIPTKFELIRKGDKLLCQFATNKVAKELKPESNKKFYMDEADIQIEFETDTLGKVTKSYFIVNNMKKEMNKLK
jgi:CubicO group peptidase (beta-lactamase class C family)